jgi:hypothetical protein
MSDSLLFFQGKDHTDVTVIALMPTDARGDLS